MAVAPLGRRPHLPRVRLHRLARLPWRLLVGRAGPVLVLASRRPRDGGGGVLALAIDLAAAYALSMLGISVVWVSMRGAEEARTRLRLLPSYLFWTTIVVASGGGTVWFVLAALQAAIPAR